jgi:hypothetical protein
MALYNDFARKCSAILSSLRVRAAEKSNCGDFWKISEVLEEKLKKMSSQERADAYLTKKKDLADAHKAEKWRTLDELYSKKSVDSLLSQYSIMYILIWFRLWHPLTMLMKECMYDPAFTMGESLKDMYTNFIHEFEHRINPLELVEIILPIAREIAKDG